MADMLDLEEAQSRILAGVARLSAERVPLDLAVSRVLAEQLVSSLDLPPFDYSAMDGYAVRIADGLGERALVGESRAGSGELPPLAMGTSMRIFTGAPIPQGADAVIMQEDAARTGDRVAFANAKPPRSGQNVRRRGEDLARGATAIAAGTRLRPTHLPLLAALEIVRPAVVRRPVVAILATGDELREPGAPARPGSIVETNGPAIAAMVREAGGEPRLLPIVRDDAESLRAALRAALDGVDVLLTIGGVSVGDHDLVRPMLVEEGVTIDFWRVAIKPGKPLAFGRRGGVTVLGLPGNPVSAMVTFVLFAAPLLRALAGDRSPLPPRRRVRLGRALAHAPGRTELVRATLSRERDDAPVTALPVASQASGSVVSIAGADALIVVPRSSEGIAAGAEVDVIPLGTDV
jgi:molybdopterin molybdotransferase